MGLWFLLQAWANRSAPGHNRLLLQVHVPTCGGIVRILREPVSADLDASGVISLRESLALGVALAMDSLGAGFGAAMAGLPVAIVPPLVGLFTASLLPLGVKTGLLFGNARWGAKGASLRGVVLLVLALWEMR